MAITDIGKRKGQGKQTHSELMGLWSKRKSACGFDWSQVDFVELLTALNVAGQSGAALMISPASGGLGVCLTIFANNDRVKAYATLPEEVNELLAGIIDEFGSSSEDARQVTRSAYNARLAVGD